MMVIVPTMLTTVAGVDALIEHLEVLALGNLDPRIHFAILTDFADTPASDSPGDAALLARATTGIEGLNDRTASDTGGRFFLFHREQQWNGSEHATRQCDHDERRRLAVRPHLRRAHRCRSVHDRGVRRLRRRHLHRQGSVRRRAFTAALATRVPENSLLSHDLFEGLYARTALVSDVEVVDDYPSSVLAHARRQHRRVRGDWQILQWVFPYVPS
jgi:hypothetical protein